MALIVRAAISRAPWPTAGPTNGLPTAPLSGQCEPTLSIGEACSGVDCSDDAFCDENGICVVKPSRTAQPARPTASATSAGQDDVLHPQSLRLHSPGFLRSAQGLEPASNDRRCQGALIGAGPGWFAATYIDKLRYYTLPSSSVR
jgi:hypothetical protein